MTDQSRPDVPVTDAGRRLLGLDMTPEEGYWVNLGANQMRRAILAIEAEARTPAADAPRLAELRAAVEALRIDPITDDAEFAAHDMAHNDAIAAVLALMATAPSERAGELDVERLADATASVVGWTGARDFHLDWARKVAAEYRRLAGADQ